MRLGKRKRRIWLACCWTLAGLVLLVLALPLWLPWCLRPIARKSGATFSDYQREGYGHWALNNVTYSNRLVVFRAQRIQGLVPTVWLERLAVERNDKQR